MTPGPSGQPELLAFLVVVLLIPHGDHGGLSLDRVTALTCLPNPGSPFHCMSYLLPSKCGYREEKGDDV